MIDLGIDPKDLTPFAGGVSLGLLPFDPTNKFHKRAMMETIYGEALVHGEGLFCEENFERVMGAMGLKKVHGEFIVASIENFGSLIAGGAIRHPDAMIEITGADENAFAEIFAAEHAEDTSLSRGASKFIRHLTATDSCPAGIGLGTWYMQERNRRAVGLRGFTSEYSQDNVPIIKTYRKFPAILGTPEDSAVHRIQGLTSAMKARLKIPLEPEGLAASNLDPLSNIFLTNWSSANGKQKIYALFTEGLSTYSTYSGEANNPFWRVQIVSNGNLPNKEALKDILASLLATGQEKIQDDLIGVQRKVHPLFGGTPPVFCIHVLKEPKIVEALFEMDAPFRELGGHRMLPAIMYADGGGVPARGLRRVGRSYGGPIFGIAA